MKAGTGHRAGEAALRLLREEPGDRVQSLPAGLGIEG